MADNRKRNFATIVYEDSAPDNWINICSDFKIPCFISPLHDRDVYPSGELKKPHWHVMIMFGGKQSPDTVRELFNQINGVGLEHVIDIGGMARYLIHNGWPDKAQYNAEDVIAFGADYEEACLTSRDKRLIINEIKDFIDYNGILSLAELDAYTRVCNTRWNKAINSFCQVNILNYLRAKQWEKDQKYNRHAAYYDVPEDRDKYLKEKIENPNPYEEIT